jgi:hypothetical protein
VFAFTRTYSVIDHWAVQLASKLIKDWTKSLLLLLLVAVLIVVEQPVFLYDANLAHSTFSSRKPFEAVLGYE